MPLIGSFYLSLSRVIVPYPYRTYRFGALHLSPLCFPFLGPHHEWIFPWGYPCRILDAPLPHSVLVAYTYPLTRIIAETYLHVLMLWSSKKPLRWNCLSFGLYYWSLWMTIKTKKTKKYSWNQKQVTSIDFSKTFMYKKKIKVQLASYQSNGSKGVNVAPTPFQDGI